MSLKSTFRIASLAIAMVLVSASFGSPVIASASAAKQADPEASTLRPPQDPLKLISARDNISGSFTTSQSVYATQTHIYLASSQGTLFVLKRSKAENFPLVEQVNIGSPLTSVRGYGTKLFVASMDGYLRQYSTTNPLTLVRSVQVSSYGLSSIAIANNIVYVAKGQTSLAVDSSNVYLSQLNEGEVAVALNGNLEVTKTFGQTYEPGVTVVYNRTSGTRKGTVVNPTTVLNETGFPSLFSFNSKLFQAVPGCCGAGVSVTPIQTLTGTRIVDQLYANAVSFNSKGLFIGDEAGRVGLYKLTNNSITNLKTLDLRQLTNHTGAEDIEIRSLWTDGYDNLVFATSSWGNSTTQSPSLPSVFILQAN